MFSSGAGETCVESRGMVRSAWQHAWLVQLVTLLITYLQALAPWQTIESFTLPLQAEQWAVGWQLPKKNASLTKYVYVGDLARMGKIKALSARFSIIKGFETFRFVEALFWYGGVYVAGDHFSHTYLRGDYTILPFLISFLFWKDNREIETTMNKTYSCLCLMFTNK